MEKKDETELVIVSIMVLVVLFMIWEISLFRYDTCMGVFHNIWYCILNTGG